MASKLKIGGIKRSLLERIAARGKYGHPSDRMYFPPSKVFAPLKRLGYVYSTRRGAWHSNTTFWHLTPKAEEVLAIRLNEETGYYEKL